MKLLLFDVDGTLIKKNTTHIDAFCYGFKKIYGVDAALTPNCAGKTHRQIFTEILREKGFSDKAIKNGLEKTNGVMLDYVMKNISKTEIKVYPGVRDTLKKLRKKGFVFGLVTGGTEEIAKVKLEIAGLWDFFSLGSYGDASDKRSDIIKNAIRKAEKIYGKINKKDIFVIGDTPLDIESGKINGIKTIGMATFFHNKKDLMKSRPDYVFRNFSEFKRSIDKIFK